MNRQVGVSLVILLLCCFQSSAQTWNEWFRQNKTQRKYLIEQIVRLQVYIEQARKGYEIMQNGLQVINDIKKGEFNLHQSFISSLTAVNPSIAAYADVAAVASRQVRLYHLYRQLIKDIHAHPLLTPTEIDLVYTASTNLIKLVAQTLDELVRVTTHLKLVMTDDERLKRINTLKQESVQQEIDLTSMKTSVVQLLFQRRSAQIDLEQLHKWHGIE